MAAISTAVHPKYADMEDHWELYRFISGMSEDFLEEYLYKREKEDPQDYIKRKRLTYVPTYAKSAVRQVCNALRQRLSGVKRVGGSDNYRAVCRGERLGIDKKHSSMLKYMSSSILPELVNMGAVGIYIDAPATPRETLQDDYENIPYVYTYRVEDIRSYATDKSNPTRFTKLLLREQSEKYDENGLLSEYTTRYRLCELTAEGVSVRFFNENSQQIDKDGEPSDTSYMLALTEIPFVYLELSESLLADISRHQIALLNLSSSDIYSIWATAPNIYAEKFDEKDPSNFFSSIETESAETEDAGKRSVGDKKGLRVPKELDYPLYVSPNVDPLKFSMEKQENIKREINELITQTLKNISSRASNSEDTKKEERREEDGLKAIGDELENADRQIAYFFAMYEGSKEIAKISYPETYQSKSDLERREEAEALSELVSSVTSPIAQRAIAKKIIKTLVGNDVSESELNSIFTEIDNAPAVISKPETLWRLVEANVVSPGTAARLLGFDAGEAELARTASIERAEAIAIAQAAAGEGGARGLNDLSPDPGQSARLDKAAQRLSDGRRGKK